MDIQFPNAIQVGGRAYAVRGRGGAGGGHSSIEQKNTRHSLRIVESGPVAAVLVGARRRNRVATYDETSHRTGPRN
jgi:hypothetical protein